MDSMIYCIFTYKDDAELVQLCVERVREVDPEAVVYVADDAAAPVPRAVACSRYIRTRFARGGNLNGLEAVCGVLDTLRWCMADAGADYIVKLDADTWVNSVEWLADGVEDYIACEKCEPWRIAGNCYRISRWAVAGALRYITERTARGEWPASWHFPEDMTIYDTVRTLRLPHRLVPYTAGVARGYHDELPLPEVERRAAVLHCGEPVGGQRAARAHVLLRMRVVAEESRKLKVES